MVLKMTESKFKSRINLTGTLADDAYRTYCKLFDTLMRLPHDQAMRLIACLNDF